MVRRLMVSKVKVWRRRLMFRWFLWIRSRMIRKRIFWPIILTNRFSTIISWVFSLMSTKLIIDLELKNWINLFTFHVSLKVGEFIMGLYYLAQVRRNKLTFTHLINSSLVFFSFNEIYRYFFVKSNFKEDYINYQVAINNKEQLLKELTKESELIKKILNFNFFSENSPKNEHEFKQ